MRAREPIRRLCDLGGILAETRPAVLIATIALLESVLEAADQDIATGRRPTAPAAPTAAQVLEAVRARGVPAFAAAPGDRLILLASLGLDLTAPRIRAALIEMHWRGQLHLARIGNLDAARAALAARGLPIELVDDSTIKDGGMTFHAVVIS